MKVFPGMHYSMGGLWVDFAPRRAHGNARRSLAAEPGDERPGSLRRGRGRRTSTTAPTASAPTRSSPASTPARSADPRWCATAARPRRGCPSEEGAFAAAKKRWETEFTRLARLAGPENPHVIAEEMGDWMTDNVTVIRARTASSARPTTKLQELAERWERIGLSDRSAVREPRDLLRQPAPQHARDRPGHDPGRAPAARSRAARTSRCSDLAKGVTEENALPRDDANFLKTTIAEHTADGPKITYAPVDTSLIPAAAPQVLRLSSPPGMPSSIRLRVSGRTRRRSSPYWEEYEIPYRPGQNVISVLMEIAKDPKTRSGKSTSPVVYDRACLEEVCGSCAMRINGVSARWRAPP